MAIGTSRDLLHRNKLAAFREFAVSQGFTVVPIDPRHGYEVLRLAPPADRAKRDPIAFFVRANAVHVTVPPRARSLLWEFLKSRKATGELNPAK